MAIENNSGSGTENKRTFDDVNGETENKRRKESKNEEPVEAHPRLNKSYFDKLPPQIRPFAFAASYGRLEDLRRLFETLDSESDERMNLMDIDDPMDYYGHTLLHMVCQNGYLSLAQFLLERGASLEKFDEAERIPLHYACYGGYTEVARLILSHAKEPELLKRMLDTVDEEWCSPLHIAARFGRVDVARLLYAHGAILDKKDVFGKTPNEYYGFE